MLHQRSQYGEAVVEIFTKRDVEPSEELSFSYIGSIDKDTVCRLLQLPNPIKLTAFFKISKAKNAKKNKDAVYAECHCGSANCLGVLFS